MEHIRMVPVELIPDPDEVEGEADQLLLDALSYRRAGRIEDVLRRRRFRLTPSLAEYRNTISIGRKVNP